MSKGTHVPIEDSAAEWTGGARSTKEKVPDGVTERGCLAGRSEASGTGRAAERQRHDLALGLTGLNVGCDEGAVRQVRAREHRVPRGAANLHNGISIPPVQSALWLRVFK